MRVSKRTYKSVIESTEYRASSPTLFAEAMEVMRDFFWLSLIPDLMTSPLSPFEGWVSLESDARLFFLVSD